MHSLHPHPCPVVNIASTPPFQPLGPLASPRGQPPALALQDISSGHSRPVLISIPPVASALRLPRLSARLWHRTRRQAPHPLTARLRRAPEPALEWSAGIWAGITPYLPSPSSPNSTAFRMHPSARTSFLTPHRKARAAWSPTASSLLRSVPLFLIALVYSVPPGINRCRRDMRHGHNELLQSKVHFHPAPLRFPFVVVGRRPRVGALFRSCLARGRRGGWRRRPLSFFCPAVSEARPL